MKYKIRKMLGLLLIFSLLMNIMGVGAISDEVSKGNDYVADDELTLEEMFEMMALQEEAVEAWNTLHELFDIDEYGNATYTDDFAGGWIGDDNNLYIALTSDSRKTLNYYGEVLEDFDCVIFEKAEYSLNELNEIRDIVFEELREDYSIISAGVSEKENKIVFGVEDLDKRSERSIKSSLSDIVDENQDLIDMDIDEGLFVLEEGEEVILNSSLNGNAEIEIRRGNTFIGIQSSGVNGTWTGGVRGFLTSGHNTNIESNTGNSIIPGDAVWRTIGATDTRIGTVFNSMFTNNGVGDYAFVQTNSNVSLPARVNNGGTTTRITGRTPDAPVGQFVLRLGHKTTGGIARVRRRDIETTITNVMPNVKLRGMTEAEHIGGGFPTRGDSGGPYLFGGDTVASSWAGIHSASNSETRRMYFTPPWRIGGFTVFTG